MEPSKYIYSLIREKLTKLLYFSTSSPHIGTGSEFVNNVDTTIVGQERS